MKTRNFAPKIHGFNSFCYDTITLGTSPVVEFFLFDTMKESTTIDRIEAVSL